VVPAQAPGAGVGVALGDPVVVGVGVGVDPFSTSTFIAVVAINALLESYPLTESECCPFATVVEFQLVLMGGDDAM
jgi:hypothetical protein